MALRRQSADCRLFSLRVTACADAIKPAGAGSPLHPEADIALHGIAVAEAFQAAEPLADLYLEKPVNPEELVTIVNGLLKTSDRAASH